MTAREAVEDLVRIARESGVPVNDAAIERSIARLGDDPATIAAFYETGLRVARGEAILVDFYV